MEFIDGLCYQDKTREEAVNMASEWINTIDDDFNDISSSLHVKPSE